MSHARPLLVGLTGSIGMGKSTTAAMFKEYGIPVWDADGAVAKAYEPQGAAIEPLRNMFPQAVTDNGVDRNVLREMIARDPGVLKQIEEIVHPIIQQDRQQFIDMSSDPILLFDIPLLFETGADKWLDKTIVVSCDAAEQERRVMARPGMTKERFNHFLSTQMPDTKKQSLADFVILTNGIERARDSVKTILAELRKSDPNA